MLKIFQPHQIPSLKFDPLICVHRHALSLVHFLHRVLRSFVYRFFFHCLFDLQLLFLNTCQKVINGVGWLDDRQCPSPILCDTAPFLFTPVVLNRGGVQQFPGGRVPLHALQHGKFFNGNVSLPNVASCNVAVHLHDTSFLQYSRRVLWCDNVYLWRFNCTWATLLQNVRLKFLNAAWQLQVTIQCRLLGQK